MTAARVCALERQLAERDAEIARQEVTIAYLEELARQLRSADGSEGEERHG